MNDSTRSQPPSAVNRPAAGSHRHTIRLCLVGLVWFFASGVFAQVPPAASPAIPGKLPLPIVVRQIPKPAVVPQAMESVTLASHAAELNSPTSLAIADPESGVRIGAFRQRNSTENGGSLGRSRASTGVTKVVASLAVVLGLLFGFIGISRRLGGSVRSGELPDEVVQVLGQFSLGGRQRACVVRFGSKLLALSVTPTGIETLGELDDADEVEGLTQLCLSRDMAVVPERLRAAVDRYANARSSRT